MSNVYAISQPPSIEGKPPAHDPGAEAATLTACMLEPECAPTAIAIAAPQDFYSASHAEIARAIADLLERNEPADATNVAIRLRETGRMSIVGGDGEIVRMMEAVPAVGLRVARYAQKVHDLAHVRRVCTTLHRLIAECYEPIPDVSAFLARVDATIGDVTRRKTGTSVATSLDVTREVARELAAPPKPTITTGFQALDRVTNGFEKSALYVLAARTSMGKTALAMQMAIAAAEAGHAVLVVSMEMPRAQLMRRIVCARARIPMATIKNRSISPSQWSAFTVASSDVARMNLRFADAPGQTLLDVKSAIRTHRPALVVVDHIGLVKPAVSKNSREQEVAAISRGLKGMAMEAEIPILALCQVGRDVAKSARRPSLSDLRESGAIEQDADGVWLIHRPGYYDSKASPEVQREAELIVAKQRDGETTSLALEWDAASATFAEPVAYA